MLPCDSPGPLYVRTRARLLRYCHRCSLAVIAHNSGLPYQWLRKFKTGATRQPSVNRVEKLAKFLS